MEDEVSLSSDQALRAIALFYDLLPDRMWQDQIKPSPARMETLSDRLKEHAPAETKPLLTALLAEGDIERKGAVAKTLLRAFSRQEVLHPYVEEALARSAEPHMALIPVDIGSLLIVLGLLSLDVDVASKNLKIHIKGKAPELVDKFTGLVKMLPRTVLEGLA